jgi:hypothetical protein
MPREVLRALAEDVDRLLLAGGMAAAGDERLRWRGQRLRELGQKVPVLAQVADAVERVAGSDTNEATSRLLDLLLVVRQIQAGLTTAGAEGPLEPLPESGPWWTTAPANELASAVDELERRAARDFQGRAQELRWTEKADLRSIGPCLRALRGGTGVLTELIATGQFGPVGINQRDKQVEIPPDAMHQAHCEIVAWAESCQGETAAGARALLAVLRDKDATLRERAVRFLGKMGKFADLIVPVLTDALQKENANVRLAAAEALGEIGPAAGAAVPALAWCARMDLGEVGEAAYHALASIQRRGHACDTLRR